MKGAANFFSYQSTLGTLNYRNYRLNFFNFLTP